MHIQTNVIKARTIR